MMHGVVNCRSDLYVCLYGDQQSLKSAPIGQYNTSEGITYGKLATVQFPENLPQTGEIVYMKASVANCPSQTWEAMAHEGTLGSGSFYSAGSVIPMYAIAGYLPAEQGGEIWNICGENSDESCESYLGELGLGGGTFTSEGPLYDKTRIYADANSLLFTKGPRNIDEDSYTICWTPNSSSTTSSLTVCNHCEAYAPPWGQFDVEPMTSGLLHAHEGDVDCATTDNTAAMATLELPAETTPELGGTIEFGPNTIGELLIVGVQGDGVPEEAAPRLLAISIPGNDI